MTYIASEQELNEATSYIGDMILESTPYRPMTHNEALLVDGVLGFLEEQYRKTARRAINAAFYGPEETGEVSDK